MRLRALPCARQRRARPPWRLYPASEPSSFLLRSRISDLRRSLELFQYFFYFSSFCACMRSCSCACLKDRANRNASSLQLTPAVPATLLARSSLARSPLAQTGAAASREGGLGGPPRRQPHGPGYSGAGVECLTSRVSRKYQGNPEIRVVWTRFPSSNVTTT